MKNLVDWREQQALQFKLTPKTPNQSLYFQAIDSSVVVACIGTAGTGKTYIAVGKAAKALQDGKTEKIILTRPLVSCGKAMGYFPGDDKEKIAPHMQPIMDCLEMFFDKKALYELVKSRVIECRALELMRGMSIKNSWIICDEAQNAEYSQLHMLMTRLDRGTKLIVTGDVNQDDLGLSVNPLSEVIDRLSFNCRPDISIVTLTEEDVMRPEIVRWLDKRLSKTKREGPSAQSESWYRLRCPQCHKTLHFNNGDESDLSQPDVEFVRCWNCQVTIDLEPNEFRVPTVCDYGENVEDTYPAKQ